MGDDDIYVDEERVMMLTMLLMKYSMTSCFDWFWVVPALVHR